MRAGFLSRLARGLFSLAVLVAMVATMAAACGGDDDEPAATLASGTTGTSSIAPSSTVPLEGEIVVYAASSLTEAFKEAGTTFQAANPKTKVTFNFAASPALATQINEGAPADVFASADAANMKLVFDKGLSEEQKIFVQNTPVVVVPKNSKVVATFADLAKPGVKLVLAGPTVPIGKYARDIFTRASAASGGISPDFSARVLANLKSDEANVRAVLTKVQLGEADAGVVYVTDIGAARNDVKQIDIPPPYNVVAQYPIAVVKSSKRAAVANAFVEYLMSPAGQAILQKYGFQPPAR